jgi:hypothetical protein
LWQPRRADLVALGHLEQLGHRVPSSTALLVLALRRFLDGKNRACSVSDIG